MQSDWTTAELFSLSSFDWKTIRTRPLNPPNYHLRQ